MKKYLNNKNGMALPMVLIIMAILMTFATSLALFAYDSLLSVKWMSNEKKAYYLSRAGIEAASYAYQVASTGSTDYRDKSNLDSLDSLSKVVAAAKAGAPVANGTEYSAPVKSNTIYAYYTTDDQEGNRFSGIQFKANGNLNDDYCIGSFVVEIGKGIDLRQYKAPSGDTYEQSTLDVVAFRCTASCGDDSNRRYRTTYAYISETESASRKLLYDDYGVLKPESFTKEPEVKINLNTGETNYSTNGTGVLGFIQNINNFFKGLFKQLLINILGGPTKKIQPYSFAHSGSLILDTPLKAKTIKAPGTVIEKNDNVVDHLYVVQTSENLFVKAGIDASAEKTGFTAIGLYGDQIVVDGDITMEVYITNPDGILANNPLTLTIAQSRFRIGTVIIGNATESGRQTDPVGGIKYVDDKGKTVVPDGVNKIFFNGNVNLKVYTQGSNTQTYRVFSAGDIAYFYGSYTTAAGQQTVDGTTQQGGSKGIDLLKFFIDASLADLEGFKQNDATKRKLEQIKKLYYASDDSTNYEPYVTGDGKTVLMRKIIVEERNDGYYVDGSKSNIKEIIQPSEGAGAKITWGRPRHGDVWNNFEKVS